MSTVKFGCCWLITVLLVHPLFGNSKNRKQDKRGKTHYCCNRLLLNSSLTVTISNSCYGFDTSFYNRSHSMAVTEPLCVRYQMSFLSTLWNKIIKMSMLPTVERCKNHKRSIWMGSWKHMVINKQSTWVFLCALCVRGTVPMACWALWPFQHFITDRATKHANVGMS